MQNKLLEGKKRKKSSKESQTFYKMPPDRCAAEQL